MEFIVTITDPKHLAGITAAREAYNAAPNPNGPQRFETDAEYVQFVMERAAASYARQHLGDS